MVCMQNRDRKKEGRSGERREGGRDAVRVDYTQGLTIEVSREGGLCCLRRGRGVEGCVGEGIRKTGKEGEEGERI